MKKLHIDDKELKDLLKRAAVEDLSSNFTSKLMIQVHETATKEKMRTAYFRQLSHKIAAIVAGAFVINLLLLISAFIQGTFNGGYEKLVSLISSHFLVKLVANPIALTGILTLAVAAWCIIYMQRHMYKIRY